MGSGNGVAERDGWEFSQVGEATMWTFQALSVTLF